MQRIFDDNGLLNISNVVSNHPSYKAIMEDGVVTDDELRNQAADTLNALRKLTELCNDEQQSAILDAISEMSVLFAVYHHYELQSIQNQ